MDCFLNLPTDLACNIFSHWLDNRCVAYLDSAYCHVAKRSVLLETVFRSPHIVLNYPGLIRFEWIQLRNIRVRCLVLTESTDTVACKDYLSKFGGYVQEITLDNCDETKLAEILHCASFLCKYVRRLRLCTCNINDSVFPLIVNFKILDDLDIDGIWSDNTLLSEPLANGPGCVLVKSMTLNITTPHLVQNAFRYVRGVERLFTTFPPPIPFCPSLVGLKVLCFECENTIPLYDDIMIQIVHFCPLIVHLSLQCIRSLSDVSGVVIARDLHYLRTLWVDGCEFTDLTLIVLATHRADTLEILSTMGCDNITSEGCSAVLQRCHKLHSVELSSYNVIDYNSGWNNVTHMKLRCATIDTAFSTVMRHCNKLQHLELLYGKKDQIDFTVLYHTVPQLRVLKLRVILLWVGTNKEPVYQIGEQDALLREIRIMRPELKVEFIKRETIIDVMKLSV